MRGFASKRWQPPHGRRRMWDGGSFVVNVHSARHAVPTSTHCVHIATARHHFLRGARSSTGSTGASLVFCLKTVCSHHAVLLGAHRRPPNSSMKFISNNISCLPNKLRTSQNSPDGLADWLNHNHVHAVHCATNIAEHCTGALRSELCIFI